MKKIQLLCICTLLAGCITEGGANTECDRPDPGVPHLQFRGCEEGLVCNVTLTPFSCTAPLGEGESCAGTQGQTEDTVCAVDLVCNSALSPATCSTRAAAGAACGRDYECSADLVCNEKARVCEASNSRAEGEPCGASSNCATGLVCLGGAEPSELGTNQTINGQYTCTQPVAAGGACLLSSDCGNSASCFGTQVGTRVGSCVAHASVANGQPCDDSRQCQSNLCGDSGCE